MHKTRKELSEDLENTVNFSHAKGCTGLVEVWLHLDRDLPQKLSERKGFHVRDDYEKVRIGMDGNKYVCLWGENMVEGKAFFGDSVKEVVEKMTEYLKNK